MTIYFRIYVASSKYFGKMCHLNNYIEQLLRFWVLSINVNDTGFTFFKILVYRDDFISEMHLCVNQGAPEKQNW